MDILYARLSKENFFLPDICNFSPIAIVLKKEGYGSYFIEIGYMIKAEKIQILQSWNINHSWSLFLDRDGIINRKIEDGYVTSWEYFEFMPDALSALQIIAQKFNRLFIITNQSGIGKGLMTEQNLQNIHKKMIEILEQHNIHVNRIYYCPHDYEKETCNCRKPEIGLGLKAKKDFPEIDFDKSIMVGDSVSDMEFGDRLGMKLCYIGKTSLEDVPNLICFPSLLDFALHVAQVW